MKRPVQDFPPGTIVIPTDFSARYTNFYVSLLQTQVPPNTQFAIGMGSEIAENRNKSLLNKTGEWVWFLDDDHVWSDDLLVQLLSRDVDIVVPVVLKKVPPYHPLAYLKMDENGDYVPLTLTEIEQPGLMEIFAAGTGGMLVKSAVIDALQYPWFELGRTFSSYAGEDLYFCHKARQMGFKIFIDLEASLGHTNVTTFTARNIEGNWGVEIDLSSSERIFLPFSAKK